MISKFLIYALCEPGTGAIRYIGKSSSGLSRPQQHSAPHNLKKNTHLPSARWAAKLKTKGFKPLIEIIEEFDSHEKLYEAEQYWISQFKALGFNLLNLTDGGPGTFGLKKTVSEETKRKMSKAHIGLKHTPEERAKISAAHKGKPKSETHKKRISEVSKGRRLSEAQCIAISRKNGGRPIIDQEGAVYLTVKEAARKLGIHKASISDVLKNVRNKTRGGFSFKYIEEDNI